jgi:hypothetical protein
MHGTPLQRCFSMRCRVEPMWAEVSRAEARLLLRSSKHLWQRCLTIPLNTTSGNKAAGETTVARQSVNTVTTQQGNEARVPLSDWGFIRGSVIRNDTVWIKKSPSAVVASESWTRKEELNAWWEDFIVRDNWETGKWRFIVWLQDLVSTVVQLYWECVIQWDLDNSRVVKTWRLLRTEWLDYCVGFINCENPQLCCNWL